MIKLKPSDLERIVFEKFKHKVIYMGTFLDKNNQKPYPKQMAFIRDDGKIISIDERHFIPLSSKQ